MSYIVESRNSTKTEVINKNKVDCSKVCVREKPGMGDASYAKCDILMGELVEKGIVRIIDIDGNNNQHVFTWSEDRTVWAIGSGCSTFYNTSRNNPNTRMIRYFNECRFEIYALRDIKKGEELTHTYKSIDWRTCFKDL